MNNQIRNNIILYKRKFPQVKNLEITESNKPDKRLKAEFIMNNKKYTVHFGQKKAYTYVDGASTIKRNRYKARASKITNKNGEYTYLLPGTANSLSYHILW